MNQEPLPEEDDQPSSSPPARSPEVAQRRDRVERYKDLPRWLIVAVIGGLLVLTGVVLVVLLWQISRTSNVDAAVLQAQLDAVKIAGGVAVGGGGLFALYLAVRRQRTSEQDLRLRERTQTHNEQVAADSRAHQERIAGAGEEDALQRRVTDLYAKAVDQVGSDNATVRLGGVYALERLAQDVPHLRQNIVNVLCSYLRTPFTPPIAKSEDVRNGGLYALALHNRASIALNTLEGVDDPSHDELAEAIIETDARRSVQSVLRRHYTAPEDDAKDRHGAYWGYDAPILDLKGAILPDVDFSNCLLPKIDFSFVRFIGDTWFKRTTFSDEALFLATEFSREDANFEDARFATPVHFFETKFQGATRFSKCQFDDSAGFGGATFDGIAPFDGATFSGRANFGNVTFSSLAQFENVNFKAEVIFTRVKFHSSADFSACRFAKTANFSRSNFVKSLSFERASFAKPPVFEESVFKGWTTFTNAQLEDGAVMTGAHVEGKYPRSHRWPPGWTVRRAQDDSDRYELIEEEDAGSAQRPT